MKVLKRQVLCDKEMYVVEQLEEPPVVYNRKSQKYISWFGVKELFRGTKIECNNYIASKGWEEI